MRSHYRRYQTAEQRWAAIGPYYAIFPSAFADSVVQEYTNEGDVVIDPFAGRGTAIYSAATNARIGIGIEINPVGWVYAKAKLQPATKDAVCLRLEQIDKYSGGYKRQASQLPQFFQHCFSSKTRRFLLAARDNLNWRKNKTDWTTVALLLVYLHGKKGQAMSNQMRQTKAMSPPYSIRWWKKKKFHPPEIDPLEFMRKRINWRYAKGTPATTDSRVYLGDSVDILGCKTHPAATRFSGGAALLFTSPPYYGVTNYYYDQWIRLWLLGWPDKPKSNNGKHRDRFADKEQYIELLKRTFEKVSNILNNDAVIYVRTDGRKYTLDATKDVLRTTFPGKRIHSRKRPFTELNQTKLFANKPSKAGEVDLIVEL